MQGGDVKQFVPVSARLMSLQSAFLFEKEPIVGELSSTSAVSSLLKAKLASLRRGRLHFHPFFTHFQLGNDDMQHRISGELKEHQNG